MNPTLLATVAVGFIVASNVCSAGGTLGTDELAPLMKQKPEVYAALLASFEFRDSAWAAIRFGDSYPHLTGARAGPYEIEATVKASGQKIAIVLCTDIVYLNVAGERLTGDAEEKAESIKETLRAVVLKAAIDASSQICP